jgi:hypothetical protein
MRVATVDAALDLIAGAAASALSQNITRIQEFSHV